MNSDRKHSLAAGIFYLLTFVSIVLGVLLEIVVALAGIGTAVALYPVVKRQGESRAVGFAAQYHWTFFFSRSFIPAINGVLLGSLLYQSRLVPRWLPTLGFIGAALLVTSGFAVLLGSFGAVSPSLHSRQYRSQSGNFRWVSA